MKKLTLIIAILLAGQVTAETIIVDQAGKGDFTTIQAGINNASTGDTILVKTGVYIEGVNINKAIAVIGDGAEVTTIYYASVAVQMNTSGAEISGFTIQSTQAITLSGGAEINVKNCIIIGNASDDKFPAVALSSKGKVLNTVIKDSRLGLRAGGNSADVLVTNCIFYNNNYAIQVGYSSYEEGTVTVQNSIFIGNSIATRKYDSRYGYLSSLYSCFYDNTTNFSSGTAAGLGDITVDPKFEDITKSFILQSDSPGRDAGNPNAGYNDGDGSRNDMGVYGGPYSWGKGPVITDIAITPATINQGGAVTITATAKKN